MSYRKARMEPPKPKAHRQYLKAPPPTPPEFDPEAREAADNTIVELPEHPMLMRALAMICVIFLGLPSQPVPSPNWDSLPMIPARIRRIVYMYLWGPPNDCSMFLTKGGRQGWLFCNDHANKSILGIYDKAPKPFRIEVAPDADSDNDDNDDADSFVGTNDGFED